MIISSSSLRIDTDNVYADPRQKQIVLLTLFHDSPVSRPDAQVAHVSFYVFSPYPLRSIRQFPTPYQSVIEM